MSDRLCELYSFFVSAGIPEPEAEQFVMLLTKNGFFANRERIRFLKRYREQIETASAAATMRTAAQGILK